MTDLNTADPESPDEIAKLNKEIGRGVAAALISLVATVVLLVVGLMSASDNEVLKYYGDPWILIDLFLNIGLAYLLWRKWRWAGVILILLAILGTIDQIITFGQPKGLILTVVFIYLWYRAARACFILHKSKPTAERKPHGWGRRILMIIGGLVGVAIAALIGFFLLSMFQVVTSGNVHEGSDLRSWSRKTLIKEQIIVPEDEVVKYFFEGFVSARDGGTVLTNKDLIVYWLSESDEVEVLRTPISEIVAIEQTQEGTTFEYGIWLAHLESGSAVEIWLDDEDGLGSKFVELLQRKAGITDQR